MHSPQVTTVAMASMAAAAAKFPPTGTDAHPAPGGALTFSAVLEQQSLSLASGTAETGVLLVFAYAGAWRDECLERGSGCVSIRPLTRVSGCSIVCSQGSRLQRLWVSRAS